MSVDKAFCLFELSLSSLCHKPQALYTLERVKNALPFHLKSCRAAFENRALRNAHSPVNGFTLLLQIIDDLAGDLENEEDVFIAQPDPIRSEFGGLPSKEAYV